MQSVRTHRTYEQAMLAQMLQVRAVADSHVRLAGCRADVGRPFGMEWTFTDPGVPKHAAIMVSRYDHCLLDLLWRARRGELDLDGGLVISNHLVL